MAAEVPIDEYSALVDRAMAHMGADRLRQLDTPIDMRDVLHPFENDSNGQYIPFIYTAIERGKHQDPALASLDVPMETFEELKPGVAYGSNGIVFKILREQKKESLNRDHTALIDIDFAKDTCILTCYAEVQRIGVPYLGAMCCDIGGERIYILMSERAHPYLYSGPPLMFTDKGPSGPYNLQYLMYWVTHCEFKVHGDFCVKNIVEKDKKLYVIDLDAAELYNLLNHIRYQPLPYLEVMMTRFNSALPGGSGRLTRTPTLKEYRDIMNQIWRRGRPYGGSLKRSKRKTRKYKRKNKRFSRYKKH